MLTNFRSTILTMAGFALCACSRDANISPLGIYELDLEIVKSSIQKGATTPAEKEEAKKAIDDISDLSGSIEIKEDGSAIITMNKSGGLNRPPTKGIWKQAGRQITISSTNINGAQENRELTYTGDTLTLNQADAASGPTWIWRR